MPRLCVLLCRPKGDAMHRFPDPDKQPERFRAWVHLVGGKLETASDYEYFKRQRICDSHFTDKDKNRNNRLNAMAVPSLHLPGSSMHAVNIDQASPSMQHVLDVPSSLSTDSVSPMNAAPIIAEASTFKQFSNIHSTKQHSSNVTQTLSTNTGSSMSVAIPSTSMQHVLEASLSLSTHKGNESPLNYVLLEHNYAVVNKNIKTPRKVSYSACSKIRRLQTEVSRLRKKNQAFQSRLRTAEKLSDTALLHHLSSNMTKSAQLFLQMQLQAAKKPKGRRFSTDEKVLALSLYKKSPKSYALLCNYFSLPSIKAMKRLLSCVKLYPGINKIIFEKIKKSLADKHVSERLCSLMFDEMSLTPHISYNAQEDMFHGFVTNSQTRKFADHVLVFMVKGIKENFKQPIAYYFTSGLNKTELKSLMLCSKL